MTNQTITPNPKTLTIYGAMLAGLFALTACGGAALPTDTPLENRDNTVLTQSNSSWFSNGSGTPLPASSEVNAEVSGDAPAENNDEVEVTVAPTPDSQTAPQTLAGEAGGGAFGTVDEPAPEPVADVTATGNALLMKRQQTRDLPTEETEDSPELIYRNQFLKGGETEIDSSNVIMVEGGETEIVRVPRGDRLKLTRGEAYYDGVAIGDDVASGVDFFTVTDSVHGTYDAEHALAGQRSVTSTRYHYAGILSGTNLGAPVNTTDPTAIWNGSFKTHNTNAVDFELTVDFANSKISAFVRDTAESSVIRDGVMVDVVRNGITVQEERDNVKVKITNYYRLDGTYTDKGFIDGTVNWGEFTNGISDLPTNRRVDNGILQGLIGKDGAVGVFLSGTDVSGTGRVTGGTGPSTDRGRTVGYVGGFVAAPGLPGNPDVTLGDWRRAVEKSKREAAEAEGASGSSESTVKNEFVTDNLDRSVGVRVVLNVDDRHSEERTTVEEQATGEEETTSEEPTYVTTLSAVKTASGVEFFTSPTKYRAGLLTGTDLGAPLTDSPSRAEWKGTFQSVRAPAGSEDYTSVIVTDFKLKVTFGGAGLVGDEAGSVEAFVAHNLGSNFYLLLEGKYDSAGVITGTTNLAIFTNRNRNQPADTSQVGTLTGLIGEDGAVGAFLSDGVGDNYAGGFVVVPFTLDTEIETTFGDWTRSFDDNEHSTTPTAGTPKNEFLLTTGRSLAVGDLKADTIETPITVTTLDLNTAIFNNNPLDGDADDGVAFFRGQNFEGSAGYAGIFASTNVGAPLENAKGVWNGQFQTVGVASINTDFTLEVTFGGAVGAVGTVEAFIKLNNLVSSNVHYLLRGTYSETGVITGTVSYGEFANGDRNVATTIFEKPRVDGTLTGLIGEDGAVGAVLSDAPDQYSGGFVAISSDYVTYQTWRYNHGAGRLMEAADVNSARLNTFLQSGENGINVGNIENADVKVLKIENTDNGASFFHATRPDGKNVFAAGILAETDVGRPITDRTSPAAYWNGKIQWVGKLGDNGEIVGNGVEKDFVLTINFTPTKIDALPTTKALPTIEAFVKMNDATDHYLDIKASYNEYGQLTNGKVRYGVFADGDKTATPTKHAGTTGDRTLNGKLTGLIGQNGAIGAFISDDDHLGQNYGFAGAFVAAPTPPAPPTVNYESWLQYGANSSAPVRPSDAPSLKSQILRATNQWGLDKTGVDVVVDSGLSMDWALYHRDTYDGRALAGDYFDAVAFFKGHKSGKNYYYAGVLNGTDLGAPLEGTSASQEATLYGQMNVIRDVGGLIVSDLTLTVSFTGNNQGSIRIKDPGDGSERSVEGYTIFGSFNDKGVVTGRLLKVAAGEDETATLAGLIGAEGIVAGFAGETFGGGFVAISGAEPAIPTPVQVTYADWLLHKPAGSTPNTSPDPDSKSNHQFVQLPEGQTLFDWKSWSADVNIWDPVNLGATAFFHNRLDVANSIYPRSGLRGGITYLHAIRDLDLAYKSNAYATTGARRVRYAAIHPHTNVGEPLLPTVTSYFNEPTGKWLGHFTAIRSNLAKESTVVTGSQAWGRGTGRVAAAPGSTVGFIVNYNTRTINLQEASQVQVAPGFEFIDVRYDNNGIITGTLGGRAHQLHFPDATVTGIIGAKGMVATFVSRTDVPLASGEFGTVGGWVACPTWQNDFQNCTDLRAR